MVRIYGVVTSNLNLHQFVTHGKERAQHLRYFRGSIPQSSNWNGARIGFVAEKCLIVPDMALLFDVSLDYLGSSAGSQCAVDSVLQQHDNHNFRVPAGRYSGKPDIVVEAAVELAFVGIAKVMAHDLGRAGLAGKIDPLQMGRAGRASWSKHRRHGIGDLDPILRIKVDSHWWGLFGRLVILRGKLAGRNDVRSI